MFELTGRFVEGAGRPFIAYKVLALFTERVTLEDVEQPVWRPSERWAPVEGDGRFTLVLPNKQDLRDPLLLELITPEGEVLFNAEFVVADLPAELEPIGVAAKELPAPGSGEPDDPAPGRRVKISGRVLDVLGKRQVSNRQVVFYGKRQGTRDDAFDVVLATCTDKQGYFSAEHPRRRFSDAYAVVGVGDRKQIHVHLDKGALPLHPVLVVAMPETEQDEVPPCRTEVPRSPDNEDLTSAAGTYSTDLGLGQCVNFTAPNRTLEEFSFFSVVRTTEPVIQGLTLTEGRKVPPEIIKELPGRIFDGRRPGSARQARAIKPALLKALLGEPDRLDPETLKAAERQTDVDDFISAVNAVTKSVAGRDILTADNPVDWDDEPTFYQATTIAHGHLLHLKQTWKADGYSLGDLLYSLPLAPCQKKQIAVIDWDRREAAVRGESLEEEERLASMVSRDRDISEIVNSTLREQVRGGSRSSNWGIGAGYGSAGSATIPLQGAIIQVGSVLGISGGAGSSASGGWTKASRDLATTMLQQLRDRTMQSASASRSLRSTIVQTVQQGESMRVQTEVVTNHNHCHTMTIEYFEVLRHFQVLQEITDVQECLFVPLLMSRFDPRKALRWREPLRELLRDASLRPAFDAIARRQNNYQGSDLPPGRYSQEAVETLDGELRISFQLARPRDAADGALEGSAWHALIPFLWASPSAIFNLHLAGREQAERDRIFQTNIAPRIAEAFVQGLKFFLVTANGAHRQAALDPTLVSRYAPNTPLYVSLRPEGGQNPVSRESIANFEIRASHELPPDSRAVVHSGAVRYRTKYMNHFLFREPRILNDLVPGDPALIPTPLSREELRNPREEDRELAYKLLAHLNEHLEYYHRAIWWYMDAERRFMLLDGFVAPTADGRSVASVVENRLIGVVGNCLVMPVARGFHLDPTFSQDRENPVDLLHHYAPTTPIPPMRVSVPTRGVFAEAVMGACNSCEDKDESKFWRFEESPCGDEPTAILPVSSESRRAEPGGMTPTPFPAPMINLQNAPAAPDPTGLTAALQLLGNANLFRDLSGLTETQRNAMTSMTASLDAAKFFGAEAAKLAQQRALSQDIGKILSSTQKAQKDGLIEKEQASEIATTALRGLAGAERPKEEKLTEQSEVKNLIKTAGDRPSADVTLTREGETVSVKTTPLVPAVPADWDYASLAAHYGLWAFLNNDPSMDKWTVHIDQTNLVDSKVGGFRPAAVNVIKFQVHSVTFETTLPFEDLIEQFNYFEQLPDPAVARPEKIQGSAAGISEGDEFRWHVEIPQNVRDGIRDALLIGAGVSGPILARAVNAVVTRHFDVRIREVKRQNADTFDVTAETLYNHPYAGGRTWRLKRLGSNRFQLETMEANTFPWLADYQAEMMVNGTPAKLTWQRFLERFLERIGSTAILTDDEDWRLLRGDHTRYYTDAADFVGRTENPRDRTDEHAKRFMSEYATLRSELDLVLER